MPKFGAKSKGKKYTKTRYSRAERGGEENLNVWGARWEVWARGPPQRRWGSSSRWKGPEWAESRVGWCDVILDPRHETTQGNDYQSNVEINPLFIVNNDNRHSILLMNIVIYEGIYGARCVQWWLLWIISFQAVLFYFTLFYFTAFFHPPPPGCLSLNIYRNISILRFMDAPCDDIHFPLIAFWVRGGGWVNVWFLDNLTAISRGEYANGIIILELWLRSLAEFALDLTKIMRS